MSISTAPFAGFHDGSPLYRRGVAGLRSLASVETVLGVAGGLVLLSYAIVAAAHWNDRYQINMVSGMCVALAQRLNDGVFYPALFDGEHYGGTRYMPLPFVLHAGLARATGEYLVSGKTLTYLLSSLLFAQLYVLLRGLKCGRGSALALTALVPLTPAGFLACTTIRGDLLPVVLQLAALGVALRKHRPRNTVAAGLLCALAVLAKITAVWAGAAILVAHLVAGRRRGGALFLSTWIGTLAALLYLCNLASSGRMLASFAALAVPGSDAHSVAKAPFILLAQVANGGLALSLLVPAAAIGCVLAARQRSITVHHLALFFCVPILAAICTDPGVDYNHLLDLVVLSVLATGHLWGALSANETVGAGPRLSLAVALGWVLFAVWLGRMEPRLREVGYRPAAVTRYPAVPLASLVSRDEKILTESPWIDVSRGRTPVVLDAFAFARMTRANPALAEPLLARIRTGAFAKIVLRHRLGDGDRTWEDHLFGRPVVRAVEARYCLRAEADGFFVYVPQE